MDEPFESPAEAPALATVGRFLSAADALVAQSVLQAYGVPAFLSDLHFCQQKWSISFAIGVRLHVPASEEAIALALLAPQLPPEPEGEGEVEWAARSFRRRMFRPSLRVFVLWAFVIWSYGTGIPAPVWVHGRRWKDEGCEEGVAP